MSILSRKLPHIAATGALLMAASSLTYAAEKTYKVTITNITKSIAFTPFIAATHNKATDFYSVGEPASEELAALAEGGDVVPLMDTLLVNHRVNDIETTEGLLQPGNSVSFTITTAPGARFFSTAAMLLPTNDTFVGLDTVRLPLRGKATFYAHAYDAGSEMNDELCISIPGPTCGGEGVSAGEDDEGYVYPSPGIHGEGDLSTATYNWQGPVAKVTIKTVHQRYK
ncbi:spondin domain-containing protein [Halioxenophilus aromaticivorans]|uniref:Spondin domain-containing protein n=1 Tax=Halioxenophilus aromaticivorans TaxID=1306992 RepID=A0AAV3U8S8_9ALTE